MANRPKGRGPVVLPPLQEVGMKATQPEILQIVTKKLWSPGSNTSDQTFDEAHTNQKARGDDIWTSILADLCDEAELDAAGNVTNMTDAIQSMRWGAATLERVADALEAFQEQKEKEAQEHAR